MKDSKKKSISDVIKFLESNPEYGRAFHEYYEDLRDELIAVKWTRTDPNFDKKCAIGAEFIQANILNVFNLKKLSRRD
jgi:hypothetical protein